MDRTQLFDTLSNLPPAAFEGLLFAVKPPGGLIPGDTAPQINRVKALLDWAEGPSGRGIDKVQDCFNKLQNATLPTAFDFSGYLQAVCEDDRYRKVHDLYTETEVLISLEAETVEQKSATADGNHETESAPPKVERFPVLEGLRKYALGEKRQHLLLAGRPGSGKSTTLKRLLLEQAKVVLADSTQPVPIYIQLKRDISLLELIANELEKGNIELEEKELKRLLRRRHLLLLLDGVNEIPSDEQRRKLQEFREDNSTTPMIFTTRDLAVGGDLGIQKRLEMRSLSEPQMREFVGKYLTNRGMPDQAKALLRQLRDRLREIAETPLLLKMLCDVFDPATQQIPQSKGELFRQFDQDYEHIKKDTEYVPVSENFWEFKADILQFLAFSMIQTDDTKSVEACYSVANVWAEKLLETWLNGRGVSDPATKAKLWLKDLRRCHLLQVAKDPGDIEFHHQLFQEYYAAEYLLQLLPNLSNEELKRDYLNLLKWTEPIALMLALVDEEELALRVVKLAIDDVDLMLGARLAGEVRSSFQEQSVQLISDLNLPDWLNVKALGLTQTNAAISRLLKLSRSKDFHIRLKLEEELLKIGSEDAISGLIELVSQDHPDVPCIESAVLTKLGIRKAVTPDLRAALRDDNSDVRKIAVESFVGLDSEVAVPELLEVLNNKIFHIRFDSSVGLARLGNNAAIPELLKGLEDEELHWEAERALQELGSEEAIPGLIKILDEHEDSDVRSRAVEVLGNLGDEEAISGLLKAFKDQDYHVLSRAERALEELKSETAIPELLKFLQDENLNVCRRAADLLEKLGNEAIIPELFKIIKEELSHELSNTIRDISTLLVSLSNDVATPVLREALNDEIFYVRFIASLALAKIGNEDAIPELINALTDENIDVRLDAVEALGELNSKAAIVILTKALDDERDDNVVIKIEQVLTRKGGEEEVDDLTKAVQNEDIYLRRIDELEELSDDEAISLLINALKNKSKDMDYGDTKFIAAWSLRNLNREKIISELLAAFPCDNHNLLLRAIESSDQIGDEIEIKLSEALDFDKSPDVRRDAAEALGQMNNKAAIDWLLVALQYGHIKAGPALQNIKGDLAAYALPELLTLIPTSSGSPISPGQAAFRALIAIQNHCQFYNYEIFKDIIPQGNTISLYVSYAAADEVLQIQLANHLTLLERQGVITSWSSHQILPGDDRTQTIHRQINTADIILLLISAHSLSDDTCYHLEIQRAMDRHQSGDARVIPILLRPVDWQGAPFSQLHFLPKNHQPVTTWHNQDEAFQEIATGIREIALELRRNASAAG